jgi:hypothetical protein
MEKGKKETDLENLANPFSAFTVLKGEFETPEGESDIETPTKDIIEDKDELEVDSKLDEGNKKLEEVIKKQTKALDKKSKIEEPTTEEDEKDSEDNAGKEDTQESTGVREFVKTLYNKGIIDVDDTEEDFEDTEEGIEKSINKTVEKRIDKWTKSLPEDFFKMLEFVENGGTPKQFLDIFYGNDSWKDFNIESEEAQKLAVRQSLKLSGESDDDIEEIVEEWYDNGTLEKRAKSALAKLQKIEETEKQQFVEKQKQAAEVQKGQQKEYWDNFKKDLFSKEEIKGFKLTPKLKEKLWDHMTAIDKKSGKTAYQQSIENDADASLLFALQSMTNFDIAKLEKQVETKAASKMSNLLKNYSKSTKEKISSGGTEYNDDENPFKAFKQK